MEEGGELLRIFKMQLGENLKTTSGNMDSCWAQNFQQQPRFIKLKFFSNTDTSYNSVCFLSNSATVEHFIEHYSKKRSFHNNFRKLSSFGIKQIYY